MALLDISGIQKKAREEINAERTKTAVERLKELYTRHEKAALVVKNLQREIDNYLAEIHELTTYEAAGCDVGKSKT